MSQEPITKENTEAAIAARAEWARADLGSGRHVYVEPNETWLRIWRDSSPKFWDKCVAHMLINGTKYGPVHHAYPARVDAIASLKVRLELYEESGNVEYLEDIANFAMIEWMHPRHPEAHYKHEADGSIGRVNDTGLNQMGNADLNTIARG